MEQITTQSPGEKFMSRVYDITRALAVLFLIIQVVIVSYVVFGRFILNKTPRWGEELALLCMVWFSLLSASMAEYNQAHIRVRLNKFFLPPGGVKVVEIANHLVKLGIALFMIIAGFQLVTTTRGGVLSGIHLSMAWLYLSVPISGTLLFLTLLFRTKEVLTWETR